MNAPASAQFIFNWDQPRRRSLILIGFIVASFVIHVAASYLFQVVYPQTVSLLPAPRRVSLMTANSEQTATLLRWIDSEDPALVSTTRRPPHLQRREMGKVEHVPSYFAREPALKEPPPLAVDLRSLYRHEHIAPEALIKGLYRIVATEDRQQPDHRQHESDDDLARE